MNPVVSQALELLLIAYPTIFAVTLLFIALTVALKKVFPATQDEE